MNKPTDSSLAPILKLRPPIPSKVRSSGAAALQWLLALAVIATLYWTKSLLIPVVVASMFALLLSPLVAFFKRFRVPRSVSALVLVTALVLPFTLFHRKLSKSLASCIASCAWPLNAYREKLRTKQGNEHNGDYGKFDITEIMSSLILCQPSGVEACRTQRPSPTAVHNLFVVSYRAIHSIGLHHVRYTSGEPRSPRLAHQRTFPLWKETAVQIRQWLQYAQLQADQPLVPNRYGQQMTRSNVSERLASAVATAVTQCPQLAGRAISPHTFRHSTAMHLLHGGVDITVIALWLGHESPATTHGYIEADMAMKERALAAIHSPQSSR